MRFISRRSLSFATALVLLVLATAMPVAQAADAKTADKTKTDTTTTTKKTEDISAQLTHSYNADPAVQNGMIVKLKEKSPDTVVPLPRKDIKSLLGVVIPQGNGTVVITPETVTTQQVLVATTGHYNVLVTNETGPIKVGDLITISSIDGVGMKADESEPEVIGKAASNFTGSANVLGSVKLKDVLGREKSINIGRISVDLSISHNPLYQRSIDYVPTFMAKIVTAITKKPVSTARIYISLAVLVITASITGNMMYSGIRNGMIAVGRNPLSKKSIIRSLIQTVMAGLIVFAVGVVAVYLILKL